jgi:zinc protease
LGLDYFTRYPARLAGVTAEGVREVAGRYLIPGNLLVVAAGDRAAIAPGLERLMLGPSEVRAPDGTLVGR